MSENQPHGPSDSPRNMPGDAGDEGDASSATKAKSEDKVDAPAVLPCGDGAEIDPAAESELWEGRTSCKHYAARIAIWAVAVIVFIVLVIKATPSVDILTAWRSFLVIVVGTVGSGLVVIGRILLAVYGMKYRITTQRIFTDSGIISITTDQTELIRVDDVRVHKTLVDRIFDLGTVRVLSTDTTDNEILMEGIFQPDAVAEAVRSHMRAMRRKSLFVENL